MLEYFVKRGEIMAKVITVVSGKGGVGKSTFCVNTALALSKKNKKVLLIDGDISLRSLDLLLGVDEMVLYDWSDVLTGRCDPDKARLFYNDKLQLLPAPLKHPETLNADNFKSLLMEYYDDYDYILIDGPAGVSELPLIYAHCADLCVIVATPDNISARSACIAGTQLSNAGICDDNLRLVINRFDKNSVKTGKLLNVDEIIDITYLKLIGVVPEEKKLMHLSVSGKDLPTYCKAKIAFNNIADRISGKEIPLNL